MYITAISEAVPKPVLLPQGHRDGRGGTSRDVLVPQTHWCPFPPPVLTLDVYAPSPFTLGSPILL